MGLSWQQGPLGGQFLAPGMPERVLYAEPLRRRLSAVLGGEKVVQSDDAVVLFEPGRYPVAYFPRADFADAVLRETDHRTRHRDLGETAWFEGGAGDGHAARGAWEHVALPAHAAMLEGMVALAWRAMDACYEEDDRLTHHDPRAPIPQLRLRRRRGTPRAAARSRSCPRRVTMCGAMTGRLLSLNVGRPREVAWEGKTVRTAIWKDPVDGPRMVRRINIDGDDQADRLAHGGEHRAVFVYQIESYRYWERELGRDDFSYGQFGENFTVEGLADDEVCIGDRYRIGGALFEVTQPRVTCYRVGIRMDNPAMPSLLVAHHRPGFYFRVLEEGPVEAGDAIEKVADGPEGLTIADVDALLYLPNKSRATLERALRVPALSEGWKGSFRELLAKPAVPEPPAWPGFRPMRVAEVRRESTTIASFRLVPVDADAPAPDAAAGQYLTVRVRPDGEAAPLVRSYSMSDLAGERGYRISVKREGAASRFLHDHVRAGDVLDVAAPRGSFVLRKGTRPVVLVSAGVGATPVLAMLRALAIEHGPRAVWWLHGARSHAEHAFAAEVDELLAGLPDGHRLVAYSRPEDSAALGSDYDVAGRIDLAVLDRAGVPADADYYLCGPDAFMRAVGAALTARGVEPGRVATEAFGAVAVHASGIVSAGARAPHPPDGAAGTGPVVTFVRSNVAAAWDERFGSLLDFAEACDVPAGFGCRTGVCHNCESGLLSGAVAYDLDPLEPPPDGRVLLCCTRPSEELTLDL